MAVPSLSSTTSDPRQTTADVLVVGVVKTPEGPRIAASVELPELEAMLVATGATGAVDEVRRLPPLAGCTAGIALVGLGPGVPDADALRGAAGSAARQLAGVPSLAFALPTDDADQAAAVLEGAAIGAYAFHGYRTGNGQKSPASAISVHTEHGDEGLVDRASALATAVHTVRDLVNTPPSDLYPESFAAAAVELAAGLPVSVEVLAEPELRAGGFGGILGVGRGSERGPRLAIVRYSPEGATRHLALVGKGITFDSGGLSLKPAASMVGMKYDMTGAATVMAVTLAAARLRLPVRVTAWMCLAENMPSGAAIRPNDVLHMHGGATVEVLNTDAEGRLVLADGIVAASEEQPDTLIDVATLTGAARVAMGERTVPVMGDPDAVARVLEAATLAGETMWAMPMPAELRSVLESDVADLANAKPGNTAGGMLVAAHFLRHFVGKRADGSQIPWAHLDIAGAASNSGGGFGPNGKGATGVAVRTLLALTEDFSRP